MTEIIIIPSYQLVEPHNHQVDAVYKSIQTLKYHFVTGLCDIEKDFHVVLRDVILEQAMDTLNILWT